MTNGANGVHLQLRNALEAEQRRSIVSKAIC